MLLQLHYFVMSCCYAYVVLLSLLQIDTVSSLILFSNTRMVQNLHHIQRYTISPSAIFNIRGGSDTIRSITSNNGDSNPIPPSSSFSSSSSVLPISTISSVLVPIKTMMIPYIRNIIQSGPYGVIGLSIISSVICIPITQYKILYGNTVGYGLSIAMIALLLRNIFTITPYCIADCINYAALFYGIRLALYLLIRDISGFQPNTTSTTSTNINIGRIQRIPFAIFLSLFYALMMTPMLYTLRNPIIKTTPIDCWKSYIGWTGCSIAWFGVLIEAIADIHKFIVKRRKSNSKSILFRGPTHGLYQFTRHPNYTGEIMFWIGVYITGIPSFYNNSIIAWICSTIGLYGIITIMIAATKRLEMKQYEKYKNQPKYENWKTNVRTTIIPYLFWKKN
jgi:steroid 5-alpha reductase family enzyme